MMPNASRRLPIAQIPREDTQTSVYRCEEDGGIELLQVFVDEDDDEMYFTCCWYSSATDH